MALRRVGHHHLVTVRIVFKEIKNPLFFHQPTGEVKVGLPVLDAKIPRMKRALDLISHIEAGLYFFENVRDSHLLEDPALRPFRQQPELRHHFDSITCKILVSFALADAITDAAEVALLVVR